MWKYFVIGVLLLQGVNTQPSKQETQSQQQKSATRVSPTPFNEAQAETSNESRRTNDNKQAEQSNVGGSFQRTQTTQYWILVVTSIITTAAVIFYTIFAALTLKQIRRQADNASDQAEKMQGQLDAMEKQANLMDAALVESQKIAFETKRAVSVSENQSTYMKLQTDALVGQVEIMSKSFLQTGQLVEQNERAVAAAEHSAKIAQESLHIGDAPYFGITGIAFTDLDLDRYPGVAIGFMNGGRTPAWHFKAMPVLIFGKTPETGERWNMKPKPTGTTNTFYPSGEQKILEYEQIMFAYTEGHRRAVTNEEAYLFLEVPFHYRDRRKVKHPRVFQYYWHHQSGQFIDYGSA